MKQEFNAQSIHARGRTLVAGLYATPAIVLAAQNFGWMGFAVASAFIGGLLLDKKKKINEFRLFNRSRAHQAVESHSTLQLLANDLSAVMGIPEAKVYWEDPSRHTVACADTSDVAINPRFCTDIGFNRDELKFILAHELDHIRAKNDVITTYAFTLAANVLAGGYIIGTTMNVVNQHMPQAETAAGGSALYLTASMLATFISLRQAGRVTQHAIEYRADNNALRITGNLEAAKQTLEKIEEFAKPTSSENKFMAALARTRTFLYSSHPTIEQRCRNLNRTAQDMQRESAKTTPKPASP